MRLYLLPMTTRRRSLLYAQRLNQQLQSQQSLVERITARANKQWLSWEAHEKGWQKKVTDWGNGAFARIPYQEWGLKSVPPLSARKPEAQGKVEVVVPRGVLSSDGEVEGVIRTLATERQALHRKWMWWSIAGMPLTAPFALIPIIPNLPFFYLVFRAWSHWRALSGSRHLEFLLKNKLLQPVASEPLQTAYQIRTITPEQMEQRKKVNAAETVEETRIQQVLEVIDDPGKRQAIKRQSDEAAEELLLEKRSGKLVSRVLNLPGLDVEVVRAVDQISRMMAKEAHEKEAELRAARGSAPGDEKEKKP